VAGDTNRLRVGCLIVELLDIQETILMVSGRGRGGAKSEFDYGSPYNQQIDCDE
jgi:hypothetical protein